MGRLQDDIRQLQPFRSKAQEAALVLMRTADVVRRQFTALVEPYGITPQQYNVLRILRGAGDSGLPTLEVAGRMIEQTPGITRLLDRLEAKQLVRRQQCPHDRRQHLCWITASGLALVAALDAPTLRAHEESMKALKPRDRDALIRLLDAVRGSLG